MNDYLKQSLSEEKQKLNYFNKQKSKSEKISDTDYNKTINIIDSCEKLINLKINRSILKVSIMIKPYNTSKFTIIDHLKECFKIIFTYKNNDDNIINKNDNVNYFIVNKIKKKI